MKCWGDIRTAIKREKGQRKNGRKNDKRVHEVVLIIAAEIFSNDLMFDSFFVLLHKSWVRLKRCSLWLVIITWVLWWYKQNYPHDTAILVIKGNCADFSNVYELWLFFLNVNDLQKRKDKKLTNGWDMSDFLISLHCMFPFFCLLQTGNGGLVDLNSALPNAAFSFRLFKLPHDFACKKAMHQNETSSIHITFHR